MGRRLVHHVGIDCGFGVFAISKSAHSSLDGHDLAVDSLGSRIGYSKRAVTDEIGQTAH